MVNKITFKNFKLFNEKQTLELKPITILIGKNSSGKSALAKLPTLISESLKGEIIVPFALKNEDVILGAQYSDLTYERDTRGEFEFTIHNASKFLTVRINIIGKEELKIFYWNFNNEIVINYDIQSKEYRDDANNKLDCIFKGFVLAQISNNNSIVIPNLDDFRFDFDYVCSYRIQPKDINENEPKEKIIKKIGIHGEHAYEILINDYNLDKELINNVSNWYKTTFENWGIHIDADVIRKKYYFELKRDSPREFRANLNYVGQGMGQILPLITKSFMVEDDPSLTIIEEPELHLHPSAHGDLAERFAESLKDSNKRYLIETHSENFILRLRRLIAESKYNYFTEKDLMIYYVDYDGKLNESHLDDVFVDSEGNVKNWPKKVFSESLDELIAIKNAKN